MDPSLNVGCGLEQSDFIQELGSEGLFLCFELELGVRVTRGGVFIESVLVGQSFVQLLEASGVQNVLNVVKELVLRLGQCDFGYKEHQGEQRYGYALVAQSLFHAIIHLIISYRL